MEGEVALHVCRLLHLSLFCTRFSIFVRLAGSVPVDLLRNERGWDDCRRRQGCAFTDRPRFFCFLFFFIKSGNAHVHMQVRGIIRSADGSNRWRGSGKCGHGVAAQRVCVSGDESESR